MAIDPNPSPRTIEPGDGLRINDDLPAYRALSRPAIVCLILGLASILTYTSSSFAWIGVAAILVGMLALRNIGRFPDILTGGSLVRVGIASGLAFTLSALTISGVNDWIVKTGADRFGRELVETIRSKSVDEIMFLKLPISSRSEKTPAGVAEEMSHGAENKMAFDMEVKPYRDLKARISSPGQSIAMTGLGGHAVDGLTANAVVLIEVSGPVTPEFPESTQRATARIRGVPEGGTYAWSLEELQFPVR